MISFFYKILRKFVKEYLIAFSTLKKTLKKENCKTLFDNIFLKDNLMISIILKLFN